MKIHQAVFNCKRKSRFTCGNCSRSTETQPSWRTPSGAAQWGKWAAFVAVVIPLVYTMTRWAWALGFPLGISKELLLERQQSGMWLSGAALATVSLGGALLTLGLIQGWGEIFPDRIPFLGGKSMPIALAAYCGRR